MKSSQGTELESFPACFARSSAASQSGDRVIAGLTAPLPPRPTPAATSASHKKSSRPLETAESPHRSIHTPANAPPPIPPPHEIPSTRAAGETAQSPPDSASPSRRSTHSPAPPHLSPAAAAASAPKLGHRQRTTLAIASHSTRFTSSSAARHILSALPRTVAVLCLQHFRPEVFS